MKTDPYLKEIDLSKGIKSDHPDLKTDGTQYLILYSDRYMVGTFSKVWFGLVCHAGWLNPQFDTPGYNSSNWQRVWEIIDNEKDIRKQKLKKLDNEEIL
jgi:hypothetical protein